MTPTQAQIDAAKREWYYKTRSGATTDEAWSAALSAAAEVGPSQTELEMGDLAHKLFLETIERCAQVAEKNPRYFLPEEHAAAIRALKDS